jgi:hypothetical protein
VSQVASRVVTCARRADLNCLASYPDHKWAAVRAHDAGWFLSKAEELAYCPDHVPDWVPAWRAEQAKKEFKVEGSVAAHPAVLACTGCDEAGTADGEDEELVRALRDRAFQHGRETGHTVAVVTSRVLTVEAVVRNPVS